MPWTSTASPRSKPPARGGTASRRTSLPPTARRLATDPAGRPSPRRSDDRAAAGDGSADDEAVHLAGALVGVDRLGVGDVAAHVVLQQDPVAAHELARPADRLPHPHRAERLG